MEDRVRDQRAQALARNVTLEEPLRGGLITGAVSNCKRWGGFPQHAEHVHLPQLSHIKQYTPGLATGVDVGGKSSAIRDLPGRIPRWERISL